MSLFLKFRRWFTIVCLVPVAILHRCALWLDDLIFSRDLRTSPQRPVFILGIPRSGTTYLHRLLATQSHELTSLALWEILFAPALCQKLVLRAAYRLNLLVGNPWDGLLNRIAKWLPLEQNSIHATGLYAAEEDFAALLCYDLSFLRVFAFPFSQRSWDLTDPARLSASRRARFLDKYAGILRRHELFAGRRVLSKNPSFVLWSKELQRRFPSASIIVTNRTPTEVIPSQLSSLGPGLSWFGFDHRDPRIVQRFVNLLARYYQYANAVSGGKCIEYARLKNAPEAVLASLLDDLNVTPSPTTANALKQMLATGRHYSSRHRYSATEFGLDEQSLQELFPYDTEQECEVNGYAA